MEAAEGEQDRSIPTTIKAKQESSTWNPRGRSAEEQKAEIPELKLTVVRLGTGGWQS